MRAVGAVARRVSGPPVVRVHVEWIRLPRRRTVNSDRMVFLRLPLQELPEGKSFANAMGARSEEPRKWQRKRRPPRRRPDRRRRPRSAWPSGRRRSLRPKSQRGRTRSLLARRRARSRNCARPAAKAVRSNLIRRERPACRGASRPDLCADRKRRDRRNV